MTDGYWDEGARKVSSRLTRLSHGSIRESHVSSRRTHPLVAVRYISSDVYLNPVENKV